MEKNSEKLDLLFHALADATRREILRRVAKSECTISELAEPFRMTFAGVSKHIKVLESAGLLRRSVDGRIHRCQMNAEPLREVAAVIAHYQAFWESRFDALEAFLEESKLTDSKPTKPKKTST